MRLVRIALAHRVQVVREQRAVGDLAVRARVPAEVVVDADDVDRPVLGLAAGRRVAGGGDAHRAASGRARARVCDRGLDVDALDRAGPRAELVGDRPDDHRRVVAVGLDVRLELAGGELAHELLLEVLRLDRVDRDLRPLHDPQLVGALLRVGRQRVVRADDGRAELLDPRELLVAGLVVDREAHRACESSCSATPRKFIGRAVEEQVAADDLDRADAGPQRVALQQARRPSGRPATRRRGTGWPATTGAACRP